MGEREFYLNGKFISEVKKEKSDRKQKKGGGEIK